MWSAYFCQKVLDLLIIFALNEFRSDYGAKKLVIPLHQQSNTPLFLLLLFPFKRSLRASDSTSQKVRSEAAKVLSLWRDARKS